MKKPILDDLTHFMKPIHILPRCIHWCFSAPLTATILLLAALPASRGASVAGSEGSVQNSRTITSGPSDRRVAGINSVGGASLSPARPPIVGDNKSAPIPFDQIGAAAEKQYQGDGLSITSSTDGALLRCVFQRMEGRVTAEGLWLASISDESQGEKFRVVASSLGRAKDSITLARTGTVEMAGKLARFIRPGLTEEYSVSADGLRQDFVIAQRPGGEGNLRVELDVAGAKVEALANSARLVLDGSGRKIAYSRLRVVDATGRELTARLEVLPDGAQRSRSADSLVRASKAVADKLADKAVRAPALAVVVDDADAAYPVRIDPTFSDENWISMGGIPGANYIVRAAVVDGSGNLYIGGEFTGVGNVLANRVAKWDGTTWSALGSGVAGVIGNQSGAVTALAVSGNSLYVGGSFTKVGGVEGRTGIAKWVIGGTDDSSWSAMGSGIQDNGAVRALVVSGSDLYVGGTFSTAGGITGTAGIAKWNGSAWSALGSGANNGGGVFALAVSGNDLYAGGGFTQIGGKAVNYVAKWAIGGTDDSSWSALGSGAAGYETIGGGVRALAVAGGGLYVGGYFRSAGNVERQAIVKWAIGGTDNTGWSGLGSGLSDPYKPSVYALAVSGNYLYVGGQFTTAGDKTSAYVAKAALPHEPPTVSLTASPTAVSQGQAVTLTATANDVDGTVAKVEFFDGATKLGEDTSAPFSLTVNNLSVGQHSLTARATDNREATGTSTPVTVTVNRLAQTISFGPLPAKRGDDTAFVLSATASSGLPVSYTSSNPGVATVSGFAVTITGIGSTTITASQAGNATYLPAADVSQVLVVGGIPPGISSQPASRTVNAGLSASFSVTATGTAPLTYQWQFNGNNIAGAINATLTLASVTLAQAGSYVVVVSNPAGSVNSAVAILTVLVLPPAITTQPSGRSFTLGDALTLSVTVGGTAPFSYQWQFNGTNLPGAIGPTLQLTDLMTANAGDYRVIVSNSAGSVTSQPADLFFFGDLKLIASMVLAGRVGQQFRVDYADVLAPGTTNWQVLTNITLPGSPYLVIDPGSAGKAHRFYRAVTVP